jgi:hypothetical protein
VFVQSWNYNQPQGKAAKSLTLWQTKRQNSNLMLTSSIDCTNCFAQVSTLHLTPCQRWNQCAIQFKTSALIKFNIATGMSWGVPYCNLKFMAELSITAITNVDLAFNFAFAYTWAPQPIKLASITPLMDQALAGFNILGFPLTLGVSYGIDIK